MELTLHYWPGHPRSHLRITKKPQILVIQMRALQMMMKMNLKDLIKLKMILLMKTEMKDWNWNWKMNWKNRKGLK